MLSSNKNYEVVIIGSGVSALPAATTLIKAGIKCLVLDKGKYERDPKHPHEVALGIGGAGLYSDGKISFFPAGTEVWKLKKKNLIMNSLVQSIQDFNQAYENSSPEAKLECRDMPLNKEKLLQDVEQYFMGQTPDSVQPQEGGWTLKPYPCVYVPLETRRKMVEKSFEVIKDHCIIECIVHEVTQNKITKKYQINYQKNGNFHEMYTVEASHIICAGGRFMPMFLKLPQDCKRVFKRIELGVRISCEVSNPIWNQMKGVDPKYMNNLLYKNVQLRTFCCCRDGEVVVSSYNGLHSFSGRADCPSTGRSNTGFNIRIYDKELLPEFKKMIHNQRHKKPQDQPFTVPLPELIQNQTFSFDSFSKEKSTVFNQVYGEFSFLIQEGIASFCNLFPDIFKSNDIKIHGPTIEGVGDYWEVDENLKIPGHNIWITGDASGIFRGIIPSQVSGYYVAEEIFHSVEEQRCVDKVTSEKRLVEKYKADPRLDLFYNHIYKFSDVLKHHSSMGGFIMNHQAFTETVRKSGLCEYILHTFDKSKIDITYKRSKSPFISEKKENEEENAKNEQEDQLNQKSYLITQGIIRNRIVDDISYSHTYPHFTGKNGVPAMCEIHIFLADINPCPDIVKKYNNAVAEWNRLHQDLPDYKPMKNCYLALEFKHPSSSISSSSNQDQMQINKTEENKEKEEKEQYHEVCVLQSARYLCSDNIAWVVEQCHEDAQFFINRGLSVIREKIETSMFGIVGVPQTTEEMAKYPTKYFESHLRIKKKESDELEMITEEELKELKQISRDFTQLYQIPIPLSYNKAKSLEGINQRFLNLRFRGIGAKQAIERIHKLRDAINNNTTFCVTKIHYEYVPYDSYPQLDKNWIDI